MCAPSEQLAMDSEQNPSPVRSERPRARRYPFVASAELTDLQSDVSLEGRAIDLSLFGCGVVSPKPFSARTKARIRITHRGSSFAPFGRVVYVTSDGEMGIVFTQVEPNDQLILEKWISELREQAS
jgi:PilZ domain